MIRTYCAYVSALLLVLVLAGGCEQDSSSHATRSSDAPGDTTTVSSSDSSAEQVVLILGNSIAEGHGLASDQAFPARLQQKIDAQGWNVDVVNAGQSGDTSAGGLRRLDWVLRRPIDVLILELGGNDGLRGLDPAVTKKNLAAIIDSTRARYPDVRILLAGMKLPPNLGADYTRRFAQIYPTLAREKDVTLIPFLLEDVGGVDSLMQSDGIHPNAAGQRRVAQNVWQKLKPILAEDCGAEDIALGDSAAMDLDALAASADTADCAEPASASATAPGY